MHLRRRVAVLAAVLALLPLAACGEDDPAPEPSPEPTSSFDPSALDLGRLDPTRTDISAAAGPDLARRVASYELGAHLVMPQEIDPALTMANVDSGSAISASELNFMFEGDTTPVHGSTAAIFSRRSDTDFDDWIATGLMAFPDEAAAAAAAAAMHQLALAPLAEDYPPEPYEASEVPGREAALAGVRMIGDRVTFKVFEASGPFLMYAWIAEDVDVEGAQELAEEHLEEQAERLEDLDVVEIDEAPTKRQLDPTGLWGLTLAMDADGGLGDRGYVSGPHASLIHQIDLDGLDDAYDEAGVEGVAVNAAVLYRTDGADGARVLLEAFLAQGEKAKLEMTDPPVGLDAETATCLTGDPDEVEGLWPDHICWIVHDGYLVEAAGRTIDEARQVASAQLVLVHQSGDGRKRTTG